MALSALQGFDFQGSHLEDHGLSPAGDVILVPLHRHEVSLDFAQIELEMRYAVRNDWDVWVRLPFAAKDQSVDIVPRNAATPDEVAAMLANGEIHHRDETYTGLHDPMLLVARHRSGLLRAGDTLSLAAGISFPLGRIEEDPYLLGDAGEEHLHIQFGTGTFDPLLELHYGTKVTSRVSAGGFVQARTSVYENREGFRGPPEVQAGATVVRRVATGWDVRAGYTYFRQGWSHWSGVRDENSGLASHYAGVGTAFAVAAGKRLELDVRWPFSQTVLAEESDAFEQGPSVRAGLAWTIR